MFNIKKIKKNLNINGFSIEKNFLKSSECKKITDALDKILKKRLKRKQFVGQRNSIVLYNYFLENQKLFRLIYTKQLDKVLSSLIDKDYVLTTATARNQFCSNQENIQLFTKDTSGQKWHTDNRYIDGKAIKPSLSYIVVIVLEDFKKKSGATLFLKKSHKFKRKITSSPKKNIGVLTAKKGSLIFIDSNLYHCAGKPSNESRWSIFNIYSPWFVKPYFQFYKFFNKKKLPSKIKKILHYTSLPPFNYTDRIRTLVN